MKFEYIGLTDTGCKRKGNEDYFLIDDVNHIAVLSDGMGGHNAGEVASEMTSKSIIEYINRNAENEDIEDVLRQAIMYSNYLVINKGKESPDHYGMGATVLVGIFRNNCFHYAWVGDSRIYLVNNNEIKQISKDHSYVQQLFDDGLINEEEMFNHPRKNVLLSAIGVEEKEVEIGYGSFSVDILENQTILFCSDGLSDMLRNNEIQDTVINHSLREGLNGLVVKACDAGGFDNITVLGIRPVVFEESYLVVDKTKKNILLVAICGIAVVIFKNQIMKFFRNIENKIYRTIGKKIVNLFLKFTSLRKSKKK